jgi:hypothetical protein
MNGEANIWKEAVDTDMKVLTGIRLLKQIKFIKNLSKAGRPP